MKNVVGGGYYEVKQRKLSDFVRQYNEIDLVKIDIEGAESSVLKDLIDSKLLGKPNLYIIEHHLKINDFESQKNLAAIIKEFSESGFVFSLKSVEIAHEGFQDILLVFKKPNKCHN